MLNNQLSLSAHMYALIHSAHPYTAHIKPTCQYLTWCLVLHLIPITILQRIGKFFIIHTIKILNQQINSKSFNSSARIEKSCYVSMKREMKRSFQAPVVSRDGEFFGRFRLLWKPVSFRWARKMTFFFFQHYIKTQQQHRTV